MTDFWADACSKLIIGELMRDRGSNTTSTRGRTGNVEGSSYVSNKCPALRPPVVDSSFAVSLVFHWTRLSLKCCWIMLHWKLFTELVLYQNTSYTNSMRVSFIYWSASFVHLLTRGQQMVVDVGEPVQLECEFYTDDFNLFDNPILWRKTQLHETTQMNMMGNLMEPFSSVGRFRVTFIQQPPKYIFGLAVTGFYKHRQSRIIWYNWFSVHSDHIDSGDGKLTSICAKYK